MASGTTYRSYHAVKTAAGVTRHDLTAETLKDVLTVTEDTVVELKPEEVLVKVRAASIQYQDISLLLGADSVPFTPNVIPLSDLAGEVVSVGSKVTKWKAGDRVSSNVMTEYKEGTISMAIMMSALGMGNNGVLTEYRALPEYALVQVPDYLSFEEASTLPCSALTAWNAFNGPVPVREGDTVLIQGTGGVSIFALQFAVARGAIPIITSSSDAKLEFAKKLGAKHLINYKKTPNWSEEVTKITNGVGVDHVMEMGGPGTLMQSIGAVAFGGWIHAVGFMSNDESFVNVTRFAMWKSITIRGIFLGSVAQFKEMVKFISEKQIKPVVDKVFSFEESRDAIEYAAKQKQIGKVVITVAKN